MFSLLILMFLLAAVPGMVPKEVRRLTAATTIALDRDGMYLTKLKMGCTGGTPGSFTLRIDNTHRAHFGVPTDGTRGKATYKVNYKLPGRELNSDLQEFLGGMAGGNGFVEFTFSPVAPGADHKALSAFRAIRFSRTDVGAVTADVTVAFPGGSNMQPLAIVGYISGGAGRAVLASVDNLVFRHEAFLADTPLEVEVMPPMTAVSSLTLSVISDAAATSQYLVYY